MTPSNLDLAIGLLLQLVSRAGDIAAKIAAAQAAGGTPIGDADLDSAIAASNTSRQALVDAIAVARGLPPAPAPAPVAAAATTRSAAAAKPAAKPKA